MLRPSVWALGLCVVMVAGVASLPLIAAYVIRQLVLPQVEARFGAQIAVRDIVVRPKTVRLVHVSVREQKGSGGTEPVTVSEVRVTQSVGAVGRQDLPAGLLSVASK